MNFMIKNFLFVWLVVCKCSGNQDWPMCDIADGFTYKVESVLEHLKHDFRMTTIIQTARAKMNETMFEKWNLEMKSAGILINIYTTSEEIYDAPDKTFYRSLNKELREGSPGEFWQICEDLLNTALDIVGFKSFEYVYRGERQRCLIDPFPEEGHIYHVHQFWSTALDPVVTQYFGGTDCLLYVMKRVTGVNVTDISVTNQEKEVIIPSASTYMLERKIRDRQDIIQELEKIKCRHPELDILEFKPKMLIILTQNMSAEHHEIYATNISSIAYFLLFLLVAVYRFLKSCNSS